VQASGRAVYSPILMIKFLANNSEISRFGIIVSNKVSKKATLRNLIKRKIREILRLAQKKIKKGFDVVVIVSPRIVNAQGKIPSYQEIESVLLATLAKGELIV
jgi:ribonuclease P protein component